MRLFPRFSLRFAWIVLTIFLIAFGAGVTYWKRGQEHEAIVERLLAGNYAIEEDTEPWAGYFPAKRVIGLIPPASCGDEGIQAFLEIPRPADLRGLAIQHLQLTPATQEKFFAQLERCTSLEQLHLHGMNLNATQAARLKALTKLRILNLENSSLPPGSQEFLRGMHDLEIVHLNGTRFPLEQFETFDMPKLRVLQLTDCRSPELRLTNAGFGRFPLLEILTFERSSFETVSCEAGAMQRLQVLGIPDVAKPSEIAWHVLPDATPRLRALAMHPSQFNYAIREQLGRMPQLARLLFFAREQDQRKSLDWAAFNNRVVFYLKCYHQEIEEFVQARSDLHFDTNTEEFLLNYRPAQLSLSQHGLLGSKPHWVSNQWINKSLIIYKPPDPLAIVPAIRNALSRMAPSPTNDPFAPNFMPPAPGSYPFGQSPSPAPDPFAPQVPQARDPFGAAATAADPFAPASPSAPADDPFAK